jgi:hypothetical protein
MAKMGKKIESKNTIKRVGKRSIKPKVKTILEIVQDIIKNVPEESWKNLPRDGALNHDHYLYGSPKKKRK